MITEAEIVTPPFDLNLELFSAIGDAIVADAPIQIVSPPDTRQEFRQDIFDDITSGIPIVVVDPQDQELVSIKIEMMPNLELLSAIGDAIAGDPLEIVMNENGSSPDANLEFHQDILDDILTGIQIVVVEPQDQEHVPNKIKRKPRILQRPVS